jgi:hypothetical protein
LVTRRRLPIAAPSPLPPLYARWMDALLPGPLPDEKEATCSDCAMLPREGEVDGPSFFDPVTKCCTFQPDLPNFLLGRILEDRKAPARASVVARIDAKIGVSPLGIVIPPLYRAAYEGATFGRAPTLRCPHHLDDGRCGIWLHRNAVCATFYCKHVRGATSARFWREGVEALLVAVERSLSRHCLAEIGLSPDAVLATLPKRRHLGANEDGPVDGEDPAAYAQAWGSWAGREKALYEASAGIVDELAWDDVLAISGPEVRLLAGATRALYREVTDKSLPERLRASDFQIVATTKRSVRIATYSTYDPIDVPTELIALLHRFDGRRTREAIASIEKKDGVTLDAEFVQQLVDHAVLVSAS